MNILKKLKINNLSIGKRMGFGFALGTLLTIVVGGLAVSKMNDLAGQFKI